MFILKDKHNDSPLKSFYRLASLFIAARTTLRGYPLVSTGYVYPITMGGKTIYLIRLIGVVVEKKGQILKDKNHKTSLSGIMNTNAKSKVISLKEFCQFL
jgi:hypothetical protein